MARTKRPIVAKEMASLIGRRRVAFFFLLILILSIGVWHLFPEPLNVDSQCEFLQPGSPWTVPGASYRHGWTNHQQNWSEGGSGDFPRIWKPMLAAPKMRTPGQAFHARAEYHGEHDDWNAYITPSILDSPRGLNRYSLVVEDVIDNGNNMHHIRLMIPEDVPRALYDLILGVGGDYWCNANALMIHDRMGDDLFFVHITDIHISAFNDMYTENYGRGVDEINFLNPHFVIITGDITDNGMTEEFETFMRETMRFRVPVYISPGNHDWLTSHGGGIDEYRRIINPELDYAFDYGNVIRFYCMDDGPHNGMIQNIGFNNEQLKWLEEDLNRTGQLYHNRMLMNHGPWYDNLFPNAMGREEMLRIANVHNISWVFSGHTHYDRVHDGNGNRQTGHAANPDDLVKPVFVQTATFSKDRWYVEGGGYRVLEMRHGRIVNYTSDPDGDGNRDAERSWRIGSLKFEMKGGDGISMDVNVKITSDMCLNKTRFSLVVEMPAVENSRYQIYPSPHFFLVSVFPVSDIVEILIIEGMVEANNRLQLEIRIETLN